MIKNTLPISIFTAAFLLLNTAFSQVHDSSNSPFSWGGSFELAKSERYPTDVVHTKEATYLIATKKSNYSFDKLNLWIYDPKSLVLQVHTEIQLSTDDLKLHYLTYFELSESVYIVSCDEDKNQRVRKLYVHKVEVDGKVQSPIFIAEVGFGERGTYSLYSKMGRTARVAEALSFHVTKSPDEKSVAFIFPDNFDVFTSKSSSKWNFVLFDSSFDLKRNEKFTISEEEMFLSNVILTNDQHVFALGLQSFSLLKSDLLSISSFSMESLYPVGTNYFLYHLDVESNNVEATNLMLEGKGVINSKLALIDNDVVCYGFIGDVESSGFLNVNKVKDVLARSCFFIKANLKGEVETNKTYDFNRDWYQYPFHKEGVVLKKRDLDRRKEDFLLGEIFKNELGDYLFLAEQYSYRINGSSYTTNGGKSTIDNSTEEHIYGDLTVISLSNEGDLNWMRRFNKGENFGKEAGFVSSYQADLKGNELKILINDELYWTDKENFDSLGAASVKEALKHGVVAEIVIDEKGSSHKNVLFDFSENDDDEKGKDERISPRSIKVMDDGSIIFFTRFYQGYNVAGVGHFIRMGKTKVK